MSQTDSDESDPTLDKDLAEHRAALLESWSSDEPEPRWSGETPTPEDLKADGWTEGDNPVALWDTVIRLCGGDPAQRDKVRAVLAPHVATKSDPPRRDDVDTILADWRSWARDSLGVRDDGGVATYPSPQTGDSALRELIYARFMHTDACTPATIEPPIPPIKEGSDSANDGSDLSGQPRRPPNEHWEAAKSAAGIQEVMSFGDRVTKGLISLGELQRPISLVDTGQSLDEAPPYHAAMIGRYLGQLETIPLTPGTSAVWPEGPWPWDAEPADLDSANFMVTAVRGSVQVYRLLDGVLVSTEIRERKVSVALVASDAERLALGILGCIGKVSEEGWRARVSKALGIIEKRRAMAERGVEYPDPGSALGRVHAALAPCMFLGCHQKDGHSSPCDPERLTELLERAGAEDKS